MATESYHCSHFAPLAGPVLLSVPHAGRDYDPVLLAGLRVPVASIRALEDRYADLLADAATKSGVPTIIAQAPRLALDLNRAPDDLDPDSIRGGFIRGVPASAKARAGLGLIPTRLWGVGPLWRKSFELDDIAARIRDVHTPYHAAIAGALAEAKLRWGAALLIDLHSMPPVAGDDAPDIVIGDRFGGSASAQLTATAEAALKGLGFRVAINAPYAGGYIVSRHARPAANIHAVQIEVDRRLYLDAALDQRGPGLARMQRVVTQLVESLTAELTAGYAAAAE
jgi:N-formylglutamate amidohydrolase